MRKSKSATHRNINAINSKIKSVANVFGVKSKEYEMIVDKLKVADFEFYETKDKVLAIRNNAENRKYYQKLSAINKSVNTKMFIKKELKKYDRKTNIKRFKTESVKEFNEKITAIAEKSYHTEITKNEFYRYLKMYGEEYANYWYDNFSNDYFDSITKGYTDKLAEIENKMRKYHKERENHLRFAVDPDTDEITELNDIPNFNGDFLT